MRGPFSGSDGHQAENESFLYELPTIEVAFVRHCGPDLYTVFNEIRYRHLLWCSSAHHKWTARQLFYMERAD